MSRTGKNDIDQALFWERLGKELRVSAYWVCRDCNLQLWQDAEDFAQDALIDAMRFVQDRLMDRQITVELLNSLYDEARRFAATVLKRRFVDATRRHNTHMTATKRADFETLVRKMSGLSRPDAAPDEQLMADELLEQVLGASAKSSSPTYQQIAETLRECNEAGDAPSARELASLAEVSANSRRDFSRMLSKNGVAPFPTTKGEA